VGETFSVTNNGTGNLMVGLAKTAKDEVEVWYVILPGETLSNINYNVLGNVTYPFVMVQNASLTLSGNITFTINGI
jgi:predicted polyphosphate/ATP-dependent NAD kinase